MEESMTTEKAESLTDKFIYAKHIIFITNKGDTIIILFTSVGPIYICAQKWHIWVDRNLLIWYSCILPF